MSDGWHILHWRCLSIITLLRAMANGGKMGNNKNGYLRGKVVNPKPLMKAVTWRLPATWQTILWMKRHLQWQLAHALCDCFLSVAQPAAIFFLTHIWSVKITIGGNNSTGMNPFSNIHIYIKSQHTVSTVMWEYWHYKPLNLKCLSV